MQLTPVSLALLALAGNAQAQAMLRFGCSQLVVERLDPLVEPGKLGSAHLHQIVGGNAFNATMDPEIDLPGTATCTSCTFVEDKSNYWTAVLMARHPNGSLERVQQVGNGGPQGELNQKGGITMYYIPPYSGGRATAFKKGFRMIAGDPGTKDSRSTAQGICHRCFPRNFMPFGGAPCTGQDTVDIPQRKCEGGIRSTITFPTCWDGKNLDSPDHKSHVTYAGGGFGFGGGSNCPASHPVLLPTIMYEILWKTDKYDDSYYNTGKPTFLYSYNDEKGAGQHGDYMFGWEGDSLQRAMDRGCNLDRCPGVLTRQTDEEAHACTKPQVVKEPVDGWLNGLPGDYPDTRVA